MTWRSSWRGIAPRIAACRCGARRCWGSTAAKYCTCSRRSGAGSARTDPPASETTGHPSPPADSRSTGVGRDAIGDRTVGRQRQGEEHRGPVLPPLRAARTSARPSGHQPEHEGDQQHPGVAAWTGPGDPCRHRRPDRRPVLRPDRDRPAFLILVGFGAEVPAFGTLLHP